MKYFKSLLNLLDIKILQQVNLGPYYSLPSVI